mmetsp:Transcript_31935/g.5787  ORF Transcript_31935/g.5787 Transcript_31935/m.5787 type:complete len:88 (+) Transcript_31935:3170-3433(+)
MLAERHQLFKDYFAYLINNRKDPYITVPLVRRILPKSNYYTELYLQRARYVNVSWMYKALRNYRKILGSVEIKGILIPKSIVKGETA